MLAKNIAFLSWVWEARSDGLMLGIYSSVLPPAQTIIGPRFFGKSATDLEKDGPTVPQNVFWYGTFQTFRSQVL